MLQNELFLVSIQNCNITKSLIANFDFQTKEGTNKLTNICFLFYNKCIYIYIHTYKIYIYLLVYLCSFLNLEIEIYTICKLYKQGWIYAFDVILQIEKVIVPFVEVSLKKFNFLIFLIFVFECKILHVNRFMISISRSSIEEKSFNIVIAGLQSNLPYFYLYLISIKYKHIYNVSICI